MRISAESYANLMYRINELPESTSALDFWEDLRTYPEFLAELPHDISFNRIFKYTVLMYDKGSFLNVIDDFSKRVAKAIELAKFPLKKSGEVTNPYYDSVMGFIPEVNAIVLRYCRMQHRLKYSKLIIYEEAYYRELQILKEVVDPSKKKNILANVSQIEKDYEEVQRQFFNDAITPALEKALGGMLEAENLGISPEEITMRLADKKPGVDATPYGKDYMFELFERYSVKNGLQKNGNGAPVSI